MKWLLALGAALVLGMGALILTHERGRSASTAAGSHGEGATISHGEAVDLAPHLREGTWTVVEFTADW